MARSSQGFSGSRHTFLKPEILIAGEKLLRPPRQSPTGSVDENLGWSSFEVSQFLSDHILDEFRKQDLWYQAHPVLLGSWGRGELAPKSDLDLLFCGDSATVLALITDLQNSGFRIRYRIPEDFKDWSLGVDDTDLLALWRARGETPEAQAQLLAQQKKIFGNSKIKRKILRHLLQERKQRAIRFDSIQSFLEPQIKYGPGGLRDLFQGQVVLDLFSEKFPPFGYEQKVLDYYRSFFNCLRLKLHLSGYSDVLVATEQSELSRWFGYSDSAEFMRQIQRGLARVHFYSEWILLRAQVSDGKWQKLEKKKLRQREDLLSLLKKDASVLAQYKVRLALDQFQYPKKSRGKMLSQVLSDSTEDATLQAVFRSRLIDKLCPRISHLVGYVQHDQYHRFTADQHLLQACREVKRAQKRPQILGPLKKWQKDLKANDWKILAWAALYHDLAKGLQGDHSQRGEKWVLEDLKSFGFSKEFRLEVAWLVRNHLELSTAAFRKNPHAPSTWEALQKLQLNEKRLKRLAYWTAIDIRATNPEAWTEWKAKLLVELVDRLLAGGTQNYLKLKQQLPRGVTSQVVEGMEPHLFDIMSAAKLKEDLHKALLQDSSWALLRDSRRKLWLRYRQSQDQRGLLNELVWKIYSSGASIQHALIHTLPQVGVYDWFQVQTQKSPQTLLKLLSQMQAQQISVPTVQFLSITLVSQTPQEWVVSFRGVDQKGLLLAAVSKLKALGVEIRSARVHTWGRQIEDLFHINPQSQDFLEKLRAGLIS